MKKFFAFSVMIIVGITLAGCGEKKVTTVAVEGGDSLGTGFTIASCNSVANVLSCLAKRGEQQGDSSYRIKVDETLASWANMPTDQLQTNCDRALSAIQPSKDAYAQMGCPIE